MMDMRAAFIKVLSFNLLTRRFGLAAVLAFLTALVAVPGLLHGQAQSRLTLGQVEQLIRIGTPDTAIAGEIRRVGLAFVPSKDTVEALRGLGAGSQTLQAVDDLRPMLEEAKQVIPGILTEIYKALDQGNSQAVRPSLSPELVSNSRKLDAICKPFTYRAHYVESIIERPQRQFEVRVRALFQPLEEQAYVLLFGASQGQFVLQDVSDPPQDWFGPQLSAAAELTRRFLYAMKAGRQDVLSQSVSPGVDTSRLTTDPCWQLQLQRVDQFDVGRVNLKSYKGLKAEVSANVPGTFLVEQVNGEYKIVSAFMGIERAYLYTNQTCGDARSIQSSEDPNLESYTLKRFGLPVPAPTSGNSGVQPSAAASIAQPRPISAAVCAEYDSCIQTANAALRSSEWDRATAAWDNILSLGRSLSLGVCHEVTLFCQEATITLSSREISLTKGARSEFAVPPSQVTPIGVVRASARAAFRLKVGTRNFNIDFLPAGVTCQIDVIPACPNAGIAQQQAVANYVLATLPKLASGALGPSPSQ